MSQAPAPLLSSTESRTYTQSRAEATATQSQSQHKANLSTTQTETFNLTPTHAPPTEPHTLSMILPAPPSFPLFPYAPPYPIQTALMRAVYAAVEDTRVRVAVVESPTGTVGAMPSVLFFADSGCHLLIFPGKNPLPPL